MQPHYFLVPGRHKPNFLSIRQLALRNARTCTQFNSGVLAEAAKLGVEPSCEILVQKPKKSIRYERPSFSETRDKQVSGKPSCSIPHAAFASLVVMMVNLVVERKWINSSQTLTPLAATSFCEGVGFLSHAWGRFLFFSGINGEGRACPKIQNTC